jgi:hypothetical protein
MPFRKRKAIKYGTTLPGASLTDFPKYLSLADDAQIGAELSSRKFRITKADGVTQVPYGTVRFDLGGGLANVQLFAKFDLSGSAVTNDVLGYIYYDDDGDDTEDKAAVCASYIKTFLTFEEDPEGSAPQMLDWTSNANHATVHGDIMRVGPVTSIYPPTYSLYLNLSSGTDYLSFDSQPVASGNRTYIITYVSAETDPNNYTIWSMGADDPTHIGLTLQHRNGRLWLFSEPNGPSIDCGIESAGPIAHVSIRFNGSRYQHYENNFSEVNSNQDIPTLAKFNIGRIDGIGDYFRGQVDQFLVANVDLADEWLDYHKVDKVSNNLTTTFGSEENVDFNTEKPPQPIIVRLNPPTIVATVNVEGGSRQDLELTGPYGYFGAETILDHQRLDLEPVLNQADAVVDLVVAMTQQQIVPVLGSTSPVFDVGPPSVFTIEPILGSTEIFINPPPEIDETQDRIEPILYTTVIEQGHVIAPTQQRVELLLNTFGNKGVTITPPSTTKYAEAQRSSSSVVVMGSESSPFKFNPTATTFRRGGPQHVVHLTKVKPSFATVQASFTLLTPTADLLAGEFFYQSPGGYLTITNVSDIFASILPADVDSDAVTTAPTAVSSTDLIGTVLIDTHQLRLNI